MTRELFGTSKEGGDVKQANFASQGNLSAQSLSGAANVGPAAIGSIGGLADLSQVGTQYVSQDLDQSNHGAGGHGGSDNTQANTDIFAR